MCFICLQAEASKLLAELEELRSISGDHAAMSAENARLKGEEEGSAGITFTCCMPSGGDCLHAPATSM